MNASFTGKVFDIRRFCTHDGPGIRTTIFLKGCPLSCKWCQNPEGICYDTHLFYFEHKCIRCGLCVKACPHGALSQNTDGSIRIDHQRCTHCGICTEACPAQALALDCREMTVEQVVEEALRDKPFFAKEGGITLSGGEPFFQLPFSRALLEAFHSQGIHTAVETSLQLPAQQLQQVLPYLDYVIADLKIMDSGHHKAHCGVENALILENLRLLFQLHPVERILVRTPLIPGYTDDQENLRRIAQFLLELSPQVRYEYMNYNPLAQAKYSQMETSFALDKDTPMYSPERMRQFAQQARQWGIQNIIE